MSIVVSDVINASLRAIGKLGPGQTAAASAYANWIVVLNGMIDALNCRREMIFTLGSATYNLQAAKQSYTFGVGGDFNGPRPEKIEIANIILTNGGQPFRRKLKMLSDKQWAAIPLQSLANTFPLRMYNDGGFPLSTLWFHPIPSAANQVEFYTWQALGNNYVAVTDQVVLPPGYFEMLYANLAIRIAPQAQGVVTQELRDLAWDSKNAVAHENLPAPVMRAAGEYKGIDARRSSWNYLTGEDE
jgi:hypothetical protein